MLHIEAIPLLKDNYGWLLRDEATGSLGLIDASEADPVLALLKRRNLKLDWILSTHHHGDHVAGNLEVKRVTGCNVAGFEGDAHRIPGIDTTIPDNGIFALGESGARILHIPGHTLGAVAFWFEKDKAVFTGDTLFSIGCGRLFEGTAEQMFASLGKLQALPEDTRVYPGHEYTLKGCEFAMTVEPSNSDLHAWQKEAETRLSRGQPSFPSTIGNEKRCNPFLRPHSQEIRKMLFMETDSDLAVFTEVRERRNQF